MRLRFTHLVLFFALLGLASLACSLSIDSGQSAPEVVTVVVVATQPPQPTPIPPTLVPPTMAPPPTNVPPTAVQPTATKSVDELMKFAKILVYENTDERNIGMWIQDALDGMGLAMK